MKDGGHIALEELALYAMQADSPDESASARLHLEYCARCSDELARVSGDLAMLALSTQPLPVPQDARERFLGRIAAVPAPARLAEPRPLPVKRFVFSWLWVPWAAVAALALFAASLEMKIGSIERQLNRETEQLGRLNVTAVRAQQALSLLISPGPQRVLLTPGKPLIEPLGRLVYQQARGLLIFQAGNLAQVDDRKTYELWVVPANGNPPIPAGLFRPDVNGNANVVLPPLPAGVAAKAFNVTVERADGVARPTSPAVLTGSLPALGY